MKRNIHYVSLIGQSQDVAPKKRTGTASVIVFSVVLLLGMIVSLIIPLRPTVSASEKRELAKFPEFSLESLWSGEYFKGIDTWFSDTFPFREKLTEINTMLTSWHGFGDTISAINDEVGDEIPDNPTRPSDDDIPDPWPSEENVSQDTTADGTEPATPVSVDTSSDKPLKTETLGGVLIAGNAGYEYYHFIQSTADEYIGVINKTAKKLKGKSNVYDIIVPTSIDITLDETTRSAVDSSDQKKAIDYFYGSMSERVKTVDIYTPLKEHSDEYIYYRTDHHWTALGAYYAYVEFATAAGLTPVELEKFEEVSYGEFLGSFYGDTKQNKKLKKGADDLVAYRPYYSTTLNYTDRKGNSYNWPLVNNVTDYKTEYKYSCFAAGDQPYVKVVNNDMKKGKSCLVIKESFGNAMIPYIAGNYRKVYVIDYRYWSGDLYEFIEKRNISDVVFINNISATRNKVLVDDLKALCS